MKIIASLLVSLFTLQAVATLPELPNSGKEEAQFMYEVACGPVNNFGLIDDETEELLELRKQMQGMLKNPKAMLGDALDNSELGGFETIGLLAVCTMLNEVKDQIATKGCLDDETGQNIEATEALKTCEKISKKLENM